MGKWLIILGIILIVAGLLVHFQVRIPWLGRLPGDLQFKSGNTQLYFPLVTCILLSILLTFIVWLFRYFRH